MHHVHRRKLVTWLTSKREPFLIDGIGVKIRSILKEISKVRVDVLLEAVLPAGLDPMEVEGAEVV